MSIAVLYGSSRVNGNSERLTKRLIEGFETDEIYLKDYHIEPMIDYRHTEPGPYPDDDYLKLLDRVLKQDTIVIATPIYWYGLSAQLKLFIDRWSQSLRQNRTDFLASMARKRVYVIVVGGDNDSRIKGQPLIRQMEYILDFVGARFSGYVIGKGGKPGEIEQDSEALMAVKDLRAELESES